MKLGRENWSKIFTDRWNAELILDSLDEMVIAHDLNRRITFFNKVAEQVTGLKREKVLGRDCHDVMQGKVCGYRCPFCESYVPPFEPQSFHLTLTDCQGIDHRLEFTLLPIKDRNGSVVGALAHAKDVTEILELRDALARERSFRGIIGRHPTMQKIFEAIKRVSKVDVPVMIQGESGTGKELVASAIHYESHRANGPFIAVNCGAMPEGLMESELFGHVRGAFTGAIRDRKGRLEIANGGTVFLDEVAELLPSMQVKLLRVLQDKEFQPVGSEKTIKVDVRFICATNRDLKGLVKRGVFREDLYFRLCVVPICLPPLRERATDIPILVEEFIRRFSKEMKIDPPKVTRGAMERLVHYRWPGNVRELINTIQYAMIMARGKVITENDLLIDFESRKVSPAGRPPKVKGYMLRELLDEKIGVSEMARRLGVSRATIYRYLRKCDSS